MDNKKMRAEFEAYRDQRNTELEAEGHPPSSKWHVTQAHYPTWQASRAALVVELPEPMEANPDPLGECAYAQRCRAAIEAAGVRVKP